jgi:hypothetical protein
MKMKCLQRMAVFVPTTRPVTFNASGDDVWTRDCRPATWNRSCLNSGTLPTDPDVFLILCWFHDGTDQHPSSSTCRRTAHNAADKVVKLSSLHFTEPTNPTKIQWLWKTQIVGSISIRSPFWLVPPSYVRLLISPVRHSCNHRKLNS